MLFMKISALSASINSQGTLMVMIVTQKGPKLAGQTQFDLAEYLNNGIKGNLLQQNSLPSLLNYTEREVTAPILKCLDKTAKFYFTLKLTPYDGLDNDDEL